MLIRALRLVALAALSVFAISAVAQNTITLQDGLNGYAGTTDAALWGGGPDTNRDTQIMIRGESADSAVIRFAIFAGEGGPVPDNATITSATLSIYKFDGPDAVMKASRLLKSFHETQVTWNVAATGAPWTTAGANSSGNDYLGTADGQASVADAAGNGCTVAPYPAACWLSIDVTAGVQAFRSGTPNRGWKIAQVSSSVAGNYKNFNSRAYGIASLRPKLTITYTVPSGQSVTLQDGLSGYTGTTDAGLWGGSPDTNRDTQIMIRGEGTDSAVIRFPIFVAEGGPVPNNATITSAMLSIYKFDGPDAVMKASRLLKSFNETQVTWNVAASGTSWTAAGANSSGNDYFASADGQGAVADAAGAGCTAAPYPAVCWLNIDVTTGVQAFRSGTPNRGWKIAQVSSTISGNYKNFNSRAYGIAALRPKLTITYEGGDPPAGCNSGTSRPYDGAPIGGNPIQIASSGTTTVEAEHFNCGGEGAGYHDNTAGNAGGQFRTGESVDIIASTDPAGGSYVVNGFDTGEWLAYTINVNQTGMYDLAIRASNSGANAAFRIEIDGIDVTQSVSVTSTGGLDNFQWFTKTGVTLNAGQRTLRLVSAQQHFNVNQLRVVRAIPPGTCNDAPLRPYEGAPVNGNAIQIGSGATIFEAEHFNCGGEGLGYHDNVAGNSGGQLRTTENVDIATGGNNLVVNDFHTGEWLAYTLNVVQGGTYDLAILASNSGATAAFRIEIDGIDVTNSVSVPSTGSASTFQWFTKSAVQLNQGQRVLRLYAAQQLFNVDQLRLTQTEYGPDLSKTDAAGAGRGETRPTFHSMSLYFNTGDYNLDNPAPVPAGNKVYVRYRRASEDPNAPGFAWKRAWPLWFDDRVPPLQATSYRLNGAHAVGATAIAVDSGSGPIVVADTIKIAGDSNVYLVTGALSGGSLTISSPGLRQAHADNAAVAVSTWQDTSYPFRARGSVVFLRHSTKYIFELGTGANENAVNWTHWLIGTTWPETTHPDGSPLQWPVTSKQDGPTVVIPAGSTQYNITVGGSPTTGYKVYDGEENQRTLPSTNRPDHCIRVSASYVVVRRVKCDGSRYDGIKVDQGMTNVVIEQNEITNWNHDTVNRGGIDADQCTNGTTIPALPEWGPDARVRDETGAITLGQRDPVRDGNNSHIVIQRNKIYDPAFGAHPWDYGHPHGSPAIMVWEGGQQNVIRYNEAYSTNPEIAEGPPAARTKRRWFYDGFMGENNFGKRGFPGSDSDVYGNSIRNVMDDAIEAEGGGMNVRIWGNYIDHSAVGIATTVVNQGPMYVFRNVLNRGRKLHVRDVQARCSPEEPNNGKVEPDNDGTQRGYAFKAFGRSPVGGPYWGGGRQYFFNNTLLQQPKESHNPPQDLGDLGFIGIAGSGPDVGMRETWTRNNILDVWRPDVGSIFVGAGGIAQAPNDFANDLASGFCPTGVTCIPGRPTYAEDHGWSAFPRLSVEPNGPAETMFGPGLAVGQGNFQLRSSGAGSLGLNAGVPMPNFTYDIDNPELAAKAGVAAGGSATCSGQSCPDIGAHDSASSVPMKFGIPAGQ
jgi:hypothetical protein